MKPNYKALLEMATLAETHGVHMEDWLHGGADCFGQPTEGCGTVGCLLGTYIFHNQTRFANSLFGFRSFWCEFYMFDLPTLKHASPTVLNHLGLTDKEFSWLFLWARMAWNMPRRRTISKRHHLREVTTDEAVSRLRKFIYYKHRKEAMEALWNERQPRKGDTMEPCGIVLDAQEADLKEELCHG